MNAPKELWVVMIDGEYREATPPEFEAQMREYYRNWLHNRVEIIRYVPAEGQDHD